MLSPGFCSALPKQSSELASRILPGFRCATGGATPKTYFTLSIVAWYCTTSASAGAGEDCAKAGSGKAAAKKNTAKERRTGVLQNGKTKSNTLRARSQCATACDLSIGTAATRLLCFLRSMKRDAENAHRIVSLAPSATAILCAIGAKKTLVGVTKWCADVAAVGELPKLGDCWHMESPEEVVRLKPTLVIGSVPYKQETVGKLLAQPLNFLAMNPRTLAHVYADIRLLG